MDPVFVQERKEALSDYFQKLTEDEGVRNCSILRDFFNTSL